MEPYGKGRDWKKSWKEGVIDMNRIISGDSKHITEVYELIKPTSMYLICQHVKKIEQAEEIYDNFFMNFLKYAASFDKKKGKLFSWVLTITRNEIINYKNKKSERENKNLILSIDKDYMTDGQFSDLNVKGIDYESSYTEDDFTEMELRIKVYLNADEKEFLMNWINKSYGEKGRNSDSAKYISDYNRYRALIRKLKGKPNKPAKLKLICEDTQVVQYFNNVNQLAKLLIKNRNFIIKAIKTNKLIDNKWRITKL